ncbi:MAG TPA: EI24 domain-containing protein [Spirochaetota bacterium]|nr:EI24 domain-containing protein [Spirochaetota bacterium]HQP48077.1 EI24 domain-containing protein [Spirochaetota bacterium]
MMQKNISTRIAAIRPFTAFAMGAGAPFRSIITVIRQKGLLRHFVIPFFLNILVLGLIFFLSFYFLSDFLNSLLPRGDAWYLQALRFIISPILAVLLIILTALMYSITGSIIIAPFNDIISAKVESHITGESIDDTFSLSGIIDDILRITANIIKLLIIITVFQITMLLINIIPLAGSVLYAAVSFISAMFFLGFQFFDFPLERRRMVFREKLKVLWKFKFTTIGLGVGFFLISIVPVIGFLGLNLGAVGATLLYVDHIKPSLE